MAVPLARPQPKRSRMRQAEALFGWLYASPWIIGFVLFTAGPMVLSLAMAFTDWDVLTSPSWVGLANWRRLLLEDQRVRTSLSVTTRYALGAVPLDLLFGFLLAVLLNQRIRLQALIRTVYYIPAIVSGVAVAMLWRWVFNSQFGLLNAMLASVGIQGPGWLIDKSWVLTSFVIMSIWGVGGSMLVYLAGLQGIPTDLYEAAQVDGAGLFKKFRHITIPMMSPIIFFNLIMGLIGALQVFTQGLIMTAGGPDDASLFFMLHLYRNAFENFRMGYASALAWLLFVYILALTLLVFRWSAAWVYYEGAVKGR